MPVELLAGTWGNLMKTFQDKYGSFIPPQRVASSVLLRVVFSTLPKWSPSTLRTDIVLQTRTAIRSIL